MNITPFEVAFLHHGNFTTAEVHPCCKEDNVVDYAIWMNKKLAFTITRSVTNKDHWVVALKNADDEIDDTIIQQIGKSINEAEQQSI